MTIQDNINFRNRNKNKVPIDAEYLEIKGGVLFKLVNKLLGVRY